MSYTNHTNFIKAVRFIYKNIDKFLTLEKIAREVGLSPASLKRLFMEATNQMPGAFIRRLRMEYAFRSLQNREDSILEVALNIGFEDQSAFSRCFKEIFGYSPKEARKKLNIIHEFDAVTLEEPDIVEIDQFTIQSVTIQGLYFEAAVKAWTLLKEKLPPEELDVDSASLYIGIGHDNPHEGNVREDQVHFSAGIALCQSKIDCSEIIVSNGRYARFKYVGKPMNLGLAYHYIYGKWCDSSEMKINQHLPAFIVFDSFPDGLQDQMIVINVPLA